MTAWGATIGEQAQPIGASDHRDCGRAPARVGLGLVSPAAGNRSLIMQAFTCPLEDVRMAAESDGVSMNAFIVQAVAEKVAALRARGLLRDLTPDEQRTHLVARSTRARPSDLPDMLAKAGTTTAVLPGDELPEGWLPEPPAAR